MERFRPFTFLLLGLAATQAQTPPPAVNVPPDALFAGVVPRIELTISPENITKLTKNPREYVTVTIKETGRKFVAGRTKVGTRFIVHS